MRRNICFVAFLLLAFKSLAQITLPQKTGLGIGITYGNILIHTPKLNYKPSGNSYNIECNYVVQNSNKAWRNMYGNPVTGISATFINYQDSILGKAFTLMPTLQFNIYKIKTTSLFMRVGAGLSINSKFWHRQPYADTINNYISSRANMYASVLVGAEKIINKKYFLQAGYTLSHISNGGTKKPNLGINLVGAYLGFGYRPNSNNASHNLKQFKTSNTKFKTNVGLGLRFGASTAEYGKYGGSAQLPIYTSTIMATYIVRNKHNLFIGLDYEYNGKTAFFLRANSINKNNLFTEAAYVSLVFGNEFKMGHFGIPLQMGVYLRKKHLMNNNMSQKFGLFYYPLLGSKKFRALHNIYLGPLLKVNKFNADFIELTLGYNFKK